MTDYVVAKHHSWGNQISYGGRSADGQHHRWDGHLNPPPKIGDRFITEMKTGWTAAFTITEIDVPVDPGDQFFAKTPTEGEVVDDPR